MSEHPLLCNAQVVRAIRAGRQTQDRRPITKRYFRAGKGAIYDRDWPQVGQIEQRQGVWRAYLKEFPGISIGEVKSPFGKPGDVLVVKEAYQIVRAYRASKSFVGIYLADKTEFEIHHITEHEWELWEARKKPYMKTSGRYMYKSIARLKPVVKRVWVKQVQDISLEDIRAEGLVFDAECDGSIMRTSFKTLWNSIYGPDAWDRNDWVFATEFEVQNGN